jgi:hypothetical protein
MPIAKGLYSILFRQISLRDSDLWKSEIVEAQVGGDVWLNMTTE